MIWLVRLYPVAWRRRYGEEFAEILAKQRPSLGLVMDVLAGALDARINPQVREHKTQRIGDTMADEMMKRCTTGGPALSKREQMTSGIGMVASSLVLGGVYVALRRLYHESPAVEGLGYSIFPAILLFYAQMAYWRRHSVRTQVLLVGGMFVFVYLVMWAGCAVAALIEPAGRHAL
jgi:hypothetical protein